VEYIRELKDIDKLLGVEIFGERIKNLENEG
jgi:hypothetical protein